MPTTTPLNQSDIFRLFHRLPSPVEALLRKYPDASFVAGGYIRAVIAGEEISDIDLFAPSKEAAREYCDFLRTSYPGARAVETENAVTVIPKELPFTLQVIHRWNFAHPEQVIASFDFTIAQAIIYLSGPYVEKRGICCPHYYEDLAAKRLVYTAPHREEEAGGSFLRLLKFQKRGYSAPLPSIAGVLQRIFAKVGKQAWEAGETFQTDVILGLLREVDPLIAASEPLRDTARVTELPPLPVPTLCGNSATGTSTGVSSIDPGSIIVDSLTDLWRRKNDDVTDLGGNR
jgi:hypothetical protein